MSYAQFACDVLLEETPKITHQVAGIVHHQAKKLAEKTKNWHKVPEYANRVAEYAKDQPGITGGAALAGTGYGVFKLGGKYQRKKDKRTAEHYRSYGLAFRTR
jgi:hypothetical protein